MNDTIKLNTCPKCHAPIPAEAPQGLCPKCVLGGAARQTETGMSATATGEIPSLERIAAAFPQLEILELIGRGGMGFVFKARQPHLDRFVALKLLPDKLAKDPHFAERFNREGRVLARLNHPSIVSIFDFGRADDFYYLMMEYVDGVNLRQAMQAGRFSPSEALAIVPRICEALQFAHDEGILHRDIKPENILLDGKGRVKIADFGIAKLVGEDKPDISLTATGAAIGTMHYMAPEQLEKPASVDHRADIYSLGVVFYELLTGELPIGRFALPSQKTPVDSRVDDVVLRTLEKEREKRFQSAGEMKTNVEHLTEAHTSSAPLASPLNAEEDFILCPPCLPRMAKAIMIYALLAAPVLWLLGLFLIEPLPEHALVAFVQGSLNVLITAGEFLVLLLLILGGWKLRSLLPSAVAWLKVALWSHLSVMALAIAGQIFVEILADDVTPNAPTRPLGLADGLILAVVLAAIAFEISALVWLRRHGSVLKTLLSGKAEAGPRSALPQFHLVQRPARALLAAGILNWIGSLVIIALLMGTSLGQTWVLSLHELGVVGALILVFSSVIIFGALKMMKLEAYPLAVTACVLAMITTPGNVIGLPIGLWALVTLTNKEVRAAFRNRAVTLRSSKRVSAAETSHFSRKAIWSAALVGLSMMPLLPMLCVSLRYVRSRGGEIGGWEVALILIALVFSGCAITGTILGWTALSDIRAQNGKLRGAALAAFGALAWPVLIVGGATLLVPYFMVGAAQSGARNPFAAWFALLMPAATLTFVIWAIHATARWARNAEHTDERRGVLKWIFLGLVIAVLGYVALLTSRPRGDEGAQVASPQPPARAAAVADSSGTETDAWIGFTFTSVELREAAGVRWLMIDYLDEVHGDAQKSFVRQSTIPGFAGESRTTEFLKDDVALPVRHQRVEFRLPDGPDRADLEKLRDDVARALSTKSIRLGLGEEKLLFELSTAEDALLKAWIKVIPPPKAARPRKENSLGTIRLIGSRNHQNLEIVRFESTPDHPLHQIVARFSGPELSEEVARAGKAVSGPHVIPSLEEDMNIPATEPIASGDPIGTNRLPTASAISLPCPGDHALTFVLPDENLAREADRQIKQVLANPLTLGAGQQVVLFTIGERKAWLEVHPFNPAPNRFAFFRRTGRSPALAARTNYLESAVATIPPGHELNLAGRLVLQEQNQPNPIFSTTLTSAAEEPGVYWLTWYSLPTPRTMDEGPTQNWVLEIHDVLGNELFRVEAPDQLKEGWQRRWMGETRIAKTGVPIHQMLFERGDRAPSRSPSYVFLEMTMQRTRAPDQ